MPELQRRFAIYRICRAIRLRFSFACAILLYGGSNSMAFKKASKKQMDMLHGPMLKNILLFALPLAASGIIQQLFISADMAVVY